jgi:ATP-dependent DNA helicase RecG
MNKDELQLILEEGEGYRIEFKESMTSIDKELVAFANSSGGRIFLGITDDKEIKGINLTNKFKSQIQDIANNCQPPIKIILEEFENILIIKVREGGDKPYKCSSGFYIRVGPNSQKLNRNEIIEFCKAEGKIRFDELINLKFDYNTHFDPKKLEYFLKLAGISKVLDAPTVLTNLGVAERQEGKVIFNNTGILFFSKNLQDIYFHTAITCALYKGTEKVDVLDRRDFNEDLISSIDRAMNFLKQYIPLRYEMTGEPRRKEIPEIPYEALREAIIKGTNIMVEMFDDRIEITNFGGLTKGLKPEDFGKKSVLRNPNIANLLHRAGYIEKMGTGINKMKKLISKAGLSPIKFEFDTFFTATFKRPKIKETIVIPEIFNIKFDEMLRDEGVNDGVNEGVKVRLRKEIAYLNIHKYIIRTEVEKLFNISTATAERDLIILKKLGIIIFKGAPKTGKYILTDKGKEIIGNIAN